MYYLKDGIRTGENMELGDDILSLREHNIRPGTGHAYGHWVKRIWSTFPSGARVQIDIYAFVINERGEGVAPRAPGADTYLHKMARSGTESVEFIDQDVF